MQSCASARSRQKTVKLVIFSSLIYLLIHSTGTKSLIINSSVGVLAHLAGWRTRVLCVARKSWHSFHLDRWLSVVVHHVGSKPLSQDGEDFNFCSYNGYGVELVALFSFEPKLVFPPSYILFWSVSMTSVKSSDTFHRCYIGVHLDLELSSSSQLSILGPACWAGILGRLLEGFLSIHQVVPSPVWKCFPGVPLCLWLCSLKVAWYIIFNLLYFTFKIKLTLLRVLGEPLCALCSAVFSPCLDTFPIAFFLN